MVQALKPLEFIALQENERTQREFKVSFDLDEEYPVQDALPAIHHALSNARIAYNVIFSHGSYIDVLPHRASKGKAIRYISNKWSIPMDTIVTAGDSGNDADMLRGRTAAIVVGNHSEELANLKRAGTRIYFAKGHCAAGILEGLKHYGLPTSQDATGADALE